jgi:hypothetical protein
VPRKQKQQPQMQMQLEAAVERMLVTPALLLLLLPPQIHVQAKLPGAQCCM